MLAVTGANGNLGRRLLAAAGDVPLRALVRREDAAGSLRTTNPSLDVRVLDYLDVDVLARSLEGARWVVHLVGILKESSRSRYETAHEATTAALVQAAAAAGVQRLLSIGIIGSEVNAANACLRSKGKADELLLSGPVAATVVRLPMVLGESDYAAAALARRARKPVNWLLRPSSLEQPIYAGDVVAATRRMLADTAFANRVVELAGPEVLTRGALVERAARTLGRMTRVRALPLSLGMSLAAVLEWLPDPPVTRAMLGVLDHDDQIDVRALVDELGMLLTPLDTMLERCIAA